MDKTFIRRTSFLIIFLLVMVGIFSMRLVDFQLVNGEKYLAEAVNTRQYKFAVSAARGEMVDKNGRAIATNRTGFNVILNKLMLPDDKLNDTLISLVEILTSNGETWNDKTPITKTQPFDFTGVDSETGVSQDAELMKKDKDVRLSTYATADQVLEALAKKYALEGLEPQMKRTICGIRYQMSQDGYSGETNFNFAIDVSDRTVATIKERSISMPGVEIVEQAIRTYPDGTILPHITGLVGPIYREEWEKNEDTLSSQGYKQNSIKGNSGLELALEEYLRGKNGVKQIERTLAGTLKNSEIIEEPRPGYTAMLTTDTNLQKATQASATRVLEKMQAKKAGEGKEANAISIVVINTKTGGILAVVNYPSYDLNLYSTNYSEYVQNPDKPLLNRAFRGLYRAGSAFKPIVGLTGLLDGTINKDYAFNCTGSYTKYTAFGFTGNDLAAHGSTNIYRALEQSCNCYFYEVGTLVGADAFNKTANAMGLGVRAGVEVYEEEGHLNSAETAKALGIAWNPLGDTCQAAIGQKETAITPLQLANYACTLANKGKRLKIHLVSSLRDYNTGEIVKEFLPEVVSELPDNNNAFGEIEKGMVLTAQNHSNQFLKDYQFTVAMKTGTPQTGKYNENGDELFNASIVAYGPVEAPEIAIGVIAENANYGAQLSEIVRDVFDAYYINKSQSMTPTQSGVLLQ